MALEDVAQALMNPGRLCVAPTQPGLLLPYPHGSTIPLSAITLGRLVDDLDVYVASREDTGKIEQPVIGPDEWRLALNMIEWDRDAVTLFFTTTSTSGGGFSGTGYGGKPAATIRGRQAGPATIGSPLLFSPLDPDGMAVLIYAPAYLRPPRAESKLSQENLLEWSIEVLATEDASGHDIACDLLEHLSLT